MEKFCRESRGSRGSERFRRNKTTARSAMTAHTTQVTFLDRESVKHSNGKSRGENKKKSKFVFETSPKSLLYTQKQKRIAHIVSKS